MDAPDDARAMQRHARALADSIVACVPGWIEQTVVERAVAGGVDRDVALPVARGAAERAVADAEPRIRELLATDVDEQTTTPLAILRSVVIHANRALDELDVPPPTRDSFDSDAFPGDTYGLTPAALADVHPDLTEPGIAWGAAKAHVHLRRRGRPG